MGYSLDLFLDKNIDEEFICTICHDVLQDVTMIATCEHVFCKICITEWMKTSRTCPIDRQDMRKFQPPQRSYMNMLGRLQLHCPHMVLGCTTVLSLCDFKEHEERCEISPENNKEILCSNGCGVSLKKFQMRTHTCSDEAKSAKRVKLSVSPTLTQNSGGKRLIWSGVLEWNTTEMVGGNAQTVRKPIMCSVLSLVKGGSIDETEVNANNWPVRLFLQLVPKALISNIHGGPSQERNFVFFNFEPCEILPKLTSTMSNGYVGCIHFTGSTCPIRICLLLYVADKGFIGLIPKDQMGFQTRLRNAIAENRMRQPAATATPPTPAQSLLTTTGSVRATVAAPRIPTPSFRSPSPQNSQQRGTSGTYLLPRSSTNMVSPSTAITSDPQQLVNNPLTGFTRADPNISEAEQINSIVRQIEQLERFLAQRQQQLADRINSNVVGENNISSSSASTSATTASALFRQQQQNQSPTVTSSSPQNNVTSPYSNVRQGKPPKK